MFRRDKIVDKQPENVIEVTVIDSDGMNEYQFIQSPAAENIGIIKFSNNRIYISLVNGRGISDIDDCGYKIKLNFHAIQSKVNSLVISGGVNEIHLCSNKLAIDEIKITCGVLRVSVDKNRRLTSSNINFNVDQVEINGDIITEKMSVNVNQDQYGLINNGKLVVNDHYLQVNGSIINNGSIDFNKIRLVNGELFETTPASDFSCNVADIEAIQFKNDGKTSIDYSVIKVDEVEINYELSGIYAEIVAKVGSVNFTKNADCSFSWLVCVAGQSIRFDRKMSVSHSIRAFATDVYLKNLIENCYEVNIEAVGFIQCAPGMSMDNVTSLTLAARLINIETNLITIKLIKLIGRLESNIYESCVVESQLILLEGRVNCFGSLRGDVKCSDATNIFYMSKEATVNKCNDFNIKVDLLLSYGSIEATNSTLVTNTASLLSENSEFKTGVLNLESTYVGLAGKIATKEFHCLGRQRIAAQETLSIDANESTLESLSIGLKGHIKSGLVVKADTICNSASISNQTKVAMTGKTSIINNEESIIQAAASTNNGGSLSQYGKIDCTDKAEINISDLYVDERGKVKANIVETSTNTTTLCGVINAAEYARLNSTGATRFIKGAEIAAKNAVVSTGDDLIGNLKLNADAADMHSDNSVALLSGNIDTKRLLIIDSPTSTIDTDITTSQLVLTNKGNDEDKQSGELLQSQQSTISTDKLISRVEKVKLCGTVVTDHAHIQDNQSITLAPGSSVTYRHTLLVETKKYDQQGSLTQPPGKETEGNGASIKATNVHFSPTADVNLSSPLQVDAARTHYSGNFTVPVLHSTATVTEFAENCHVKGTRTKVIMAGREGEQSSVVVEQGVFIEGQMFNANNIEKVDIQGEVASNDINVKGNDLHVSPGGILGSNHSKISIDTNHTWLEGRISGDKVNIKCSNYFFQDGRRGEARLIATKLELASLVYFNLFGTTEAQQARFSSYLSLCFGLEFFNFEINNALILVNTFPHALLIAKLGEGINNIKQGKIDIFNLASLQSSLQVALALIQPFYPQIALAATVLFNTYFVSANFMNLVDILEKSDERDKLKAEGKLVSSESDDDIKLVDLLPIFIALKNMLISGYLVYSNVGSLIDTIKYPVIDKLADWGDWMGLDLPQNIRDLALIHKAMKDAATPVAGDIVATNHQKQQTNQQSLSSHQQQAIPQSLSNHIISDLHWLSSIKKAFLDNPVKFTKDSLRELYIQSNAVISSYIMPPLMLVAPSSLEDALININLFSPLLTVSGTRRGIFYRSWFSPTIALASTEVGLYSAVNNNMNLSYVENISGFYVEKNNSSYAHIFSVKAHEFNLQQGSKVRAGYAIIDVPRVKPHDIKADINLVIKYSAADHEYDLWSLKREYACYAPENGSVATITYDTDHALNFYQSLILPWSVTYKGTGVTVDHGVKIKSEGSTSLISTVDSIVMDGKLEGKTIYEQSAAAIVQHNGVTKSGKLYMIARGDIDSHRSSNTANEGSIISQRGHILNDAGLMKFDEFGYVKAKTDVIAECQSQSIVTHHAPDKHYIPGVIMGGAGLHHHNLGLYVEAGHHIVNSGSRIGAEGDYILDGNQGIRAYTYSNPYVSKDSNHHHFFGLSRHDRTESLHLQHAIFQSIHGHGYLLAPHGHTDMTSALFSTPYTTTIFSREAPIFRDIKAHSVFDTQKSLFGINVANVRHEQDEMTGQIFRSQAGVFVECYYDDIKFGNSRFYTDHVVTNAWSGITTIADTPLDHYLRSQYLTLSGHVGPLNFSVSANPDDPHRNKFWVQDPLVDSIKAAQLAKTDGQAASAMLNVLDSAVAKVAALADKRYQDIVDTSVGLSLGHTNTIAHYQTPGNHHLHIPRWVDYSLGVEFNGSSGDVGQLYLYCSDSLKFNGNMLNVVHHTHTTTLGGSWNPFKDKLDVTASYNNFDMQGRVAAPCNLHIGRAVFQNEMKVVLNNAQVYFDQIIGKFTPEVNSARDDISQSATSFAVGTSGNVGLSHQQAESHGINTPSVLKVDDLSAAHVGHAKLHDGLLTGKGFATTKPESIEQITTGNVRHTSGFALSGNLMTLTPHSASFVNTNDNVSVSAVETPAGIGVRESVQHHGMDVSVTVPLNILGLFANSSQQLSQVSRTDQPAQQEEDAKTEEQLKTLDEALLQTRDFADPERYAEDFANLPVHASNTLRPPDTTPTTRQNTFFNDTFLRCMGSQTNYCYNPYSYIDDVFRETQNDLSSNDDFHLDPPLPDECDHAISSLAKEKSSITYLYRGDSRNPADAIFKEGFVARGNNTDIFDHVTNASGDAGVGSAYISTSLSKEVAMKFPFDSDPVLGEKISYVYVIVEPDNAIDTVARLGGDKHIDKEDLGIYRNEIERAIPEKVNPSEIVGAWQVKKTVMDDAGIGDSAHYRVAESGDYIILYPDENNFKTIYEINDTIITNPNYVAPRGSVPIGLRQAGTVLGSLGLLYCAGVDTISLKNEIEKGFATGDYFYVHREISRMAGAWAAMLRFGPIGAEHGMIVGKFISPLNPLGQAACALALSVLYSSIGYCYGGILTTSWHNIIFSHRHQHRSPLSLEADRSFEAIQDEAFENAMLHPGVQSSSYHRAPRGILFFHKNEKSESKPSIKPKEVNRCFMR